MKTAWLCISILFVTGFLFSQEDPCSPGADKNAEKQYSKAYDKYRDHKVAEAIQLMKKLTGDHPDFPDAYYFLGSIYMRENLMNLKLAEDYFRKVIELCPGYDIYAYYHLARIAYENKEYSNAYTWSSRFLDEVDKIKSDEDYNEAVSIQTYSAFYEKMLGNPVPFDPLPVEGVSTQMDEYLPIISPDNEMILYTRKFKGPPDKNDLIPVEKYIERFMFSRKENGRFATGKEMPYPFNKNENEGGATLTVDNKKLFYTLCRNMKGKSYYNCDICYSEGSNGDWGEIDNPGPAINNEDTWESQPSISSDGNELYFISDRSGGQGGYDIYLSRKDSAGQWTPALNLGPVINSPGNEKSPFIHTDNKTLYFSSDGHIGMGGYDIFYSRVNEHGNWSEPLNIGYPINSYEDDFGFFVSADGMHGYFASNKLNGFGGWDLYSFELYEKARPERILFVKGKVEGEGTSTLSDVKIEIKNTDTKKVSVFPIDTVTGEYVATALFRSDYTLTVKKKGYVYETKYLSRINPEFKEPAKIDLRLEPIRQGRSYRLNDIYFDINSFELKPDAMMVIDEFYQFLSDNHTMRVSIEGHTDNVGSGSDNLLLSENRARAVYEYLVRLGVGSDRLQYKGWGETNPLSDNETEEGRAINRRTEFVIIEK